MAVSAFPYVGGKTKLAGWITGHLPRHETYVEPFGGSASVLLNKPRSNIEIFNDLDGDIIHFFETVRNRPDELKEWASRTPFSEELHGEWVSEFYSGERPDDPVERAGRFLFLRYTQFAAKTGSSSGFKRDTGDPHVSPSATWASVPDRIPEICDRLQGVSVQNQDFGDVIARYDGPETVFYADPPYFGKEGTYRVEDFEHADLADALRGIEGRALVSYADEPGGLYAGSGWTELTRGHYHKAGASNAEQMDKVTERLYCNFDPDTVPSFSGQDQTTLSEVA